MNVDDLDDTHLCIKCNATIVGLEKYIEHRKQNCLATTGHVGGSVGLAKSVARPMPLPTTTIQESNSVTVSPPIISRSSLDHTYDGFHFTEPEAPSSYLRKTAASHGGKTSKSLTDAYDLTLGADVFFSSLQLQSVQGGKTGSARHERHKSRSADQSDEQRDELPWHRNAQACTDTLMKAVREIGESKKHDETVFKPLKFVHDSPEESEDEQAGYDEGELFEPEAEADAEDDDDDGDADADGDVDADADVDGDGGYSLRHSPPAVPAEHTGGKWKPEHRPQLHVVTHMQRISPNWDEHVDEPGEEHPPEEHTRGKWVPGSKMLEYRENLIDLTRLSQPSTYWCNICCRKLNSCANYEQHLKTGYHRRRADGERQLEQAKLGGTLRIGENFDFEREEEAKSEVPQQRCRRRHRRANSLRCDLCRHNVQRHLMGKHLISHYHYRRLQQQQTETRRQSALHTILEHMPSIVLQSPFQCRPCRFYCNTQSTFLTHWQSEAHLQQTSRLKDLRTHFWCSYCQYECPSNEEMLCHLLSGTHEQVLLALNRSVPICIGQRQPVVCTVCDQHFISNMELRQHFTRDHVGLTITGSAADNYQCRFRCDLCGEPQRSRIALQRHEKRIHRLNKYYCAICHLDFETALQARRHRNQMQHKRKANRLKSRTTTQSNETTTQNELEHMLREVLDEPKEPIPKKTVTSPPAKKSRQQLKCVNCQQIFDTPQNLAQHRVEAHAADSHPCPSCGSSFQSAQALGRHSRSCQPMASTSAAAAAVRALDPEESGSSSKLRHCSECNFRTPYESDLLYHRFFHTHGTIGKSEVLQCPLCPKGFRKHSLRDHLRNHTNERIYECTECQMKFVRRHNLKNHMATMHSQYTKRAVTKPQKKEPKEKFQCGTCGKILSSKYSLKQHELTHGKVERRFRCHHKDCQYAGLTPENLKSHLLSHAQGAHKCEQASCTYVGKSLKHLKRHMTSHSTDRDSQKLLQCERCKFKTLVKSHLTRHMRCHTGEKPHQCPYCDFQCSDFDYLRKHILKTDKHKGKFVYECSICVAEQATEVFKSNQLKEYQTHMNVHKRK
ncbi:zinc finger protein 585B [Scaptodrosophila lebanonensis]|uniref:Zinc finger protein 585B n=1 Tax=Drosophila lebanonensis TaxID=7225 RepID=A0A6J2TQC7_DROLE|nr:zinc finger protein 585B [Scaptodrosophila lebanonensis]